MFFRKKDKSLIDNIMDKIVPLLDDTSKWRKTTGQDSKTNISYKHVSGLKLKYYYGSKWSIIYPVEINLPWKYHRKYFRAFNKHFKNTHLEFLDDFLAGKYTQEKILKYNISTIDDIEDWILEGNINGKHYIVEDFYSGVIFFEDQDDLMVCKLAFS